MDPRIERYQYLGFKKSLREQPLEKLEECRTFWKDSLEKMVLLEKEIARRITIQKEEEEMRQLEPIVEEWGRQQMLKAMGVLTEETQKPLVKKTSKPTIILSLDKRQEEQKTLLPPPPNAQMNTFYKEIEKGIRHGCGCLVRSEGKWKERVKQECDDCYYTYGDGAD